MSQTVEQSRPLDSTGVKVMLAIFAGLPLWRHEGDEGLRITGDGPGHVRVEAVYADNPYSGRAQVILADAEQYLLDAGFMVRRPMAIRPTILVRRFA